jgi:hypothetical protein
MSQNKNYWFEAKDESTNDILLALESKSKNSVSHANDFNLNTSKPEIQKKTDSNTEENDSKNLKSNKKGTYSKQVKLNSAKISIPGGVRSSKIKEMYSKLKIYTIKNSCGDKFSSLTTNFMDYSTNIDYVQQDFNSKNKGIYPNCIVYLKKYDMFILGSCNFEMQNYVIFVRFKFNDKTEEYEIDFLIEIPTVDKLTRIHVNKNQKFIILAFLNENCCCIRLKKRKKSDPPIEFQPLSSCLFANNKNDVLMTDKMTKRIEETPSFLYSLPQIKYLWEIKKGFYYKAVDFIVLSINRLLKIKYWTKRMNPKMLENLKKLKNETIKKKKSGKSVP